MKCTLRNIIEGITKRRHFLITLLLLLLISISADARAGALDTRQMHDVSRNMSSYYYGTFQIMKAISGVLVFIGAFKIFWKMQHGDGDIRKSIIMIVGGCIAIMCMYSIFSHMF